MSTAETTPETRVDDREHDPRDVGRRGGLSVHDRVLTRIAEQAAASVPGTVRGASGYARVVGRGYPRADVELSGGRAWIEVTVAAVWPCAITSLLEQVRSAVLAETRRQSGIDVVSADIRLDLVDADDFPTATRRVR